jgi:hypothetical protein
VRNSRDPSGFVGGPERRNTTMRGLRLGILIGAFGACGFPVAVASAQNPNPVAAYTTNGA